MINEYSLQAVANARFDVEFCRPLYDSYCFSRIPATLHTCFTGKDHALGLPADVGTEEATDFIVLFFLDGFGWRFFEQYLPKAPLLQRFIQEGSVSQITAQFPSTTAAQVTSINTGLEVGQSGVYEWFFYEPSLDRIIAPLLCSFAGDKDPGTLEKEGIVPASLYPAHTIYEDFQRQGIHSFALQPINIAHSPYSQAMFRGATYLPFHHVADALDDVLDLFYSKPIHEKRYVYVYLGDIDSAGHRHGVSSPEYSRTVMQMLTMIEERFFHRLKSREGKKSACIVTADHGMIEIVPEKTLYLNLELPNFVRYIAKNSKGQPLVPAGSCRDFFLHIIPEYLQEAKSVLEGWLGERALVITTEELIRGGFFGSKPLEPIFNRRVGNLVILPRQNHAVWWYEKDRFEQKFYGMHGGLSRSEMEIPFLFQRF
jgi:predicted AlkP superfamily pyrophosphatase or phosphodiesterase